MAALKNIRYETFCQHIAMSPKTGWPQGRCYTEAGYKATSRAADSCAARMLTRDNIQRRIAELVEPAVRKTRTTVDTLAAQLDAVFDGATGDRQWGAAGSAAAIKAKLLGFMKDKLEVSGAGLYADCETPGDVIDRLVDDAGSAQEAIDQLQEIIAMLEERAGSTARDVTPPPPRPRPSEVSAALELLRPGRRH